MYDLECGMALEPMKGNQASSRVDLGNTELFPIPAVTSVSFWTLTVFLGTLWSSMKQIKSPSVFDWEQEIVLQAMQGNRSSAQGEGEVTWFFSSCGRNLGYIIELGQE